MPLERVGRPSASRGPLSSRKLYAMSWLCVYSFRPCDAARSPKKFQRSAASSQSATKALPVGSLPVPMCPKPRMFATSHWRVELGERRVADRRRDRAVVALGLESVVVEPGAQQLGAGDVVDVAALGVGVLAVAGELDLLVADAGELLEDLLEAGREVGRVRVARDGVAHGVEDDAALAGGDQHAVAPGLHGTGCCGCGGAGWRRGRGHRRTRRHRARRLRPCPSSLRAAAAARGRACGRARGCRRDRSDRP